MEKLEEIVEELEEEKKEVWHPKISSLKHDGEIEIDGISYICFQYFNSNGKTRSSQKYLIPKDRYNEALRWTLYNDFKKYWYENYANDKIILSLPHHAWPVYLEEPRQIRKWRLQPSKTGYQVHFEERDYFKDDPAILKKNVKAFAFCQFGPKIKKVRCKICNRKILRRIGYMTKDKLQERIFYDILELHHYLFAWGDSILKSHDEKGKKNEPSVIFKKYDITAPENWKFFIELIICVIPICLHCHKLQHVPYDNKGDIYHFKKIKQYWHQRTNMQIRPWILQSESNFEICRQQYPGQIPNWLTFEDCVELNTFRSDRKNNEKTMKLIKKIFG